MDKVYKLKHIPTGLYYSNVKGMYDNKTNLTGKGKIYNRKQDITIATRIINVSKAQLVKYGFTTIPHSEIRIITKLVDWELEEFLLVKNTEINE